MERLADALRKAVHTSQTEEEFPDYLAVQVLAIADDIGRYGSAPEMISQLTFMVLDYNTYAETCCEKIGTSHTDIEAMLKRVHAAL